ncbi:glycosyltransferase family 4 protein [Massilia sp. Mn16-1_5]|uniref:glycosyltransferase family 4 protein n=1 Tax=Massilia sp. Mn16-1_5 TaxID=2079199 RepID=UPI00144605A8|nr:glycosyltransferase family 4 protein [Massilia sp. Mn16-1_5]
MKVVMFTPGLQASAIGRMATLVVHALRAAGHEVTIVRSEQETLMRQAPHDFGGEVLAWTDQARVGAVIGSADSVIYQVGDNYEFHVGCLEWLERAPGIVCLHDFFLGHLFWAWAQRHPARAEAVLKAWYGDTVATGYFGHPDSGAFIAATADTAPMTEWIGAMALGVVTHSNWGAQRLCRSCPGPVQVMPLPYNAPAGGAQVSTADQRNFRVLTVGHVNPNKRVASVIRAIGNSTELRDHAVYRLVGHVQTETVVSLSSLARNHQVNLVISDELDNAALITAIDQADVVTCLRWPSLEAASASAIEAMLYGKPVIVTDVHFYSELPDDCVLKIDPDDEVASLQRALEQLYHSPELRRQLGARAREWANATFRADRYADCLIVMAQDTSRVRPALAAVEQFTQTLSRWGATSSLLEEPHTRDALRLFAITPAQ